MVKTPLPNSNKKFGTSRVSFVPLNITANITEKMKIMNLHLQKKSTNPNATVPIVIMMMMMMMSRMMMMTMVPMKTKTFNE